MHPKIALALIISIDKNLLFNKNIECLNFYCKTVLSNLMIMIMMIMIMNLYSAKTMEEYSKALYTKSKLMNK